MLFKQQSKSAKHWATFGSHCKISLKHAAKFSKKSPCTNVPLQCALCTKVSDAIWKYNLLSHLSRVHSSVSPMLYHKLYWMHDQEVVLMKSAFLAKPCLSKHKKKGIQSLKISKEHSTQIALMYICSSYIENPGSLCSLLSDTAVQMMMRSTVT